MNITEGIIIAVLTGVGVWVAQAVAFYRFKKEYPANERKTNADANAANGEGLEHYANATKVLLEPLTQRVKELEDEKLEREDYFKALEEDWRNERKVLRDQITRLEARQAVLEGDIIALRSENASLKADKIIYERQIEDFKLQIGRLESELENYKK
jgi:chromosome segregation ATPase